jgi:hypothetical protein
VTRLDDLIASARAATVRDEHARTYVGELARWASATPAPARKSWLPWLAFGLGLAGAAAAIALWLRPRPTPASNVLDVGDRVAIVVEPGTDYRIAMTDASRTEIEVDRGTVTARLWPGATEHHLVLRGGNLEAAAKGTVYALTVDAQKGSVTVFEGEVAVLEAGAMHMLARDRARGEPSLAAQQLLAAPKPHEVKRMPVEVPPDATLADTFPVAVTIDAKRSNNNLADRAGEPDAAIAVGSVDAAIVVVSVAERWRKARLLRGQGSFDAAVTECLAIADAKDATWSPIALVEAVRIELGPLSAPEKAVEFAERFAREWPQHSLAPEASDLRCRALKQLGKPC